MSTGSNRDLPKLLRAMAQSHDAQKNKHDIILNVAADELTAAWAETSGRVAVKAWWLQHVTECLAGDLPPERIGDVIFLLRDQLKDILEKKRKSVGEGKTCYTPEDVEKAQVGLVELRNKALEVAVLLSHTIAMLAVMKRELFGDAGS